MAIRWHDPRHGLAVLEDQVGVWCWAPDIGSPQWSVYLLELLGLSEAEFDGDIGGGPNALWAMVCDDDRAAMAASVDDSARDLTPWRHSCRIRTPSGTTKHLEARGTPMRAGNGTIVWNTVIVDVSDTHAMRQELLRTLQDALARAGESADGSSDTASNLPSS